MKKIVMGLLVVCTMLFMTNASMACDCGCSKATISESVECTKDCDCGCHCVYGSSEEMEIISNNVNM